MARGDTGSSQDKFEIILALIGFIIFFVFCLSEC